MMRLIDADALNDVMYHEAFENDESYNEKNPMAKWDSGLWIRYKMFENAIDDAPTIEPKHGKWIDKGADLDGTLYYQCSNCHADVIEEQYPNCPYCLARMKGADDE